VLIHCVLVPFNNPDQTLMRWKRDVFPGLDYVKRNRGIEHTLTIIDNSAEKSPLLEKEFPGSYFWQNGNNLLYGPSLNLAVARTPSDWILYSCTRHGKMVDASWIDLLLGVTDRRRRDARRTRFVP